MQRELACAASVKDPDGTRRCCDPEPQQKGALGEGKQATNLGTRPCLFAPRLHEQRNRPRRDMVAFSEGLGEQMAKKVGHCAGPGTTTDSGAPIAELETHTQGVSNNHEAKMPWVRQRQQQRTRRVRELLTWS